MNSSGILDSASNYVIEAIHHLRHRKARPDLEGIKNFAFRRYGIDPITCTADIEKLIDRQAVVKVEFKGRISYRSLMKSARKGGSPSTGSSLPSSRSSREQSPDSIQDESGSSSKQGQYSAVCGAVAAILKDQPTLPSMSGGVSIRSICSYLQSRDNGRYSRKYIDQLIERELREKRILKVTDGSFTLSSDMLCDLDDTWQAERSEKARTALKTNTAKRAATPPRPERVGQRMKRAKKVFDPSDLDVPTRRRSRTASQATTTTTKRPSEPSKSNGAIVNNTSKKSTESPAPVEVSKKHADLSKSSKIPGSSGFSPVAVKRSPSEEQCRLCKKTYTSHSGEEDLITCKICRVHVHPSCLGFGEPLSRRVLDEETWTCPDCRPCAVCRFVNEDETGLLCSGCDKVAHPACVNEDPTSLRWLCSDCKGKQPVVPDIDRSVQMNGETPSTKDSGPWVFGLHQLEVKCFAGIVQQADPFIPDVGEWSAEAVQMYFKEAGLEDYASALKEQDVDGPSLLLLKREDVVRRMGLKLGPALKMYRHIRRLQTRRADLLYD